MLKKGYNEKEIKKGIIGNEINQEYCDIGNKRIEYWLGLLKNNINHKDLKESNSDTNQIELF